MPFVISFLALMTRQKGVFLLPAFVGGNKAKHFLKRIFIQLYGRLGVSPLPLARDIVRYVPNGIERCDKYIASTFDTTFWSGTWFVSS